MATNNAWNTGTVMTVAQGGTHATTLAANGVLYGNGTSAVGVTSVGTSGEFLTSQGSANPPRYVHQGGNLRFIEKKTASSSASLTFTTGITSTYSTYVFIVNNVIPDLGASNLLLMRISTDGGSNYIATGYSSGVFRYLFSANTILNNNNTTGLLIGQNIMSDQTTPGTLKGCNGELYCFNITNGSNAQFVGTFPNFNQGANADYSIIQGQISTANVNAFSFAFPAGRTLLSGTISLYGLLEG